MPAQANLQVNGNKVPNWSNYTVETANLESNDFKGKGWKTGEHYYGCDNPITPYTILYKPTNLQQAKCQLLYIKDTLNSLGQAPASGPTPSKKPPAKVVAEAAAAAAAELPPGLARNGAKLAAAAAEAAAIQNPENPSGVVNAVKSAASELKGPEAEGGEKVVDAAVNAAAPPPPSANVKPVSGVNAVPANSALPPPPAAATPPAGPSQGGRRKQKTSKRRRNNKKVKTSKRR
jgi:pyruvate/2-oxoglutarate dehydrogenase complex dihydrolipoamide acyltransferase (E2) component